jgi:hypothetical protein
MCRWLHSSRCFRDEYRLGHDDAPGVVAVGFIARTYVRQSKVAEKKWRRFGDEHSTAELTVSRRGIDPIPQSGAGTLERTSVDDRKGCNWSRDRLALGNPSQEMGVVAA